MKTRLFASGIESAQQGVRDERRRKIYAVLAETFLPYFFVVICLPTFVVGSIFCCGFSKGENDTARSQALNIAESTHIFFIQQHRYPQTLAELAHPPRGKPVMERVPQDPWGNDYRYRLRTQSEHRDMTLVSAGPDKTLRTHDDIIVVSKMRDLLPSSRYPSGEPRHSI